ncbi:MAG: heat-shock protein, partial [Rhizobiales bacterium]|nr:heat-shock protein [Rhizobacter sp.]
HVAGTDFDRRVELAAILPHYGFGAMGPSVAGAPAREVPNGVYFDLATWHLINTVYSPGRVAELRSMRGFYGDPRHYERLMVVVNERLGHELMARAEAAKIEVADGGEARIDLGHTERHLAATLTEQQAADAIEIDIARIVGAAAEAVTQAGLSPAQVDALYFTGGSTGLRLLASRIAAAFPAAEVVRGDRFASVATGLGLHAQRWFGR